MCPWLMIRAQSASRGSGEGPLGSGRILQRTVVKFKTWTVAGPADF